MNSLSSRSEGRWWSDCIPMPLASFILAVALLGLASTTRAQEATSPSISVGGGAQTDGHVMMRMTMGLPFVHVATDLSSSIDTGFHFLALSHGVSAVQDATRLTEITLSSVFPNPLRSSTHIHFTISGEEGVPVQVTLRVYGVDGRIVADLVNDNLVPGAYSTAWSGMGKTGSRLPNGVYFLNLRAAGKRLTRKIVILQ